MVYRISNYLLANARRNCEFFFGDFYRSCDLNEKERIFEIRLHKSLKVKNPNGTIREEYIETYIDLDRFRKYWGPQWKLIFTTDEEV